MQLILRNRVSTTVADGITVHVTQERVLDHACSYVRAVGLFMHATTGIHEAFLWMLAASDPQHTAPSDTKGLTVNSCGVYRSLCASSGAHGPGKPVEPFCVPVVSPRWLSNSCSLKTERRSETTLFWLAGARYHGLRAFRPIRTNL